MSGGLLAMTLLDAVRLIKDRRAVPMVSRAERRRRAWWGRRVTAGMLAPAIAAGMSMVPSAAVVSVAAAGVTVAALASAAPAKAASVCSGPVLVFPDSVDGGASSEEALEAASLGCSVTVFSPSDVSGMTQTQMESYFGGFTAIIVGDPDSGSCSSAGDAETTVPADALTYAPDWGPAVKGNVAVLGTAPVLAGANGKPLLDDGITWAVTGGASGSTGLYVSLDCQYYDSATGTAVGLLSGVGGGFTVTGVASGGGPSCTDNGTVNTGVVDADPAFTGLATSGLTASSWGTNPCPVEETITGFAAGLSGVAYDAGISPATFTATDGATGQAYVVAGAIPSAATAGLAPSTGGEVPPGTTAGGAGNPADGGVSQALAAGSVNTENGDLTESATDASVPTFGPSLSFSRDYDADLAQEQTQTELTAGSALVTPGPMGFGWTDNWASSVTASPGPVPGDIYAVDGLATDTGMGGPATAASVGTPEHVFYSGGNTYIADSADNRILEVAGASQTQWGITMTQGDVYTIAGSPTGASGSSSNGHSASGFLLNDPSGVTADNSGDVFIADTGNNRVLEIAASTSPWGAGHGNIPSSATADDVYVVAGTGTAGVGADGKAATSSELSHPASVFTGGNAGGNLYIADTGNNRIQMVSQIAQTKWNQTMAAYDVYTLVGSSTGKSGSSGDSGAAASALLKAPQDMTIDTSGDLVVADTGNCRVQEEAKAAGKEWGNTTSFTANDAYTIAGSSTGACGTGGDKVKATSSDLSHPAAVSSAGTIGAVYIADTSNNRVQEIAAATGTSYGQSMTIGDIYTVAGSAAGTAGFSGDGAAATAAVLNGPAGIADNGSSLFIGDTVNNRVRDVTGTSPYDITTAAGNGTTLATDGNAGPATTAALHVPVGEGFDAAGDVYIADEWNNRVQEIAAYDHTQFGITMTAGQVYTVAGQSDGDGGNWGDGGVAVGAGLNSPEAVAVDADGDLYIADSGNYQVREVYAAGGQTWGHTGWVAGDIYTVAGSTAAASGTSGDGGPASSALLYLPRAVALDKAGDLFIADNNNNRVQEVYAAGGQTWGHTGWVAGDIYTVAGSATGAYGDSGDGGPATSSLMTGAAGVAVDGSGNLYIADWEDSRIQEVPAASGLQRGQQMTLGYIYTIAGSASGANGLSGDGGPATSALLYYPFTVAADAAGDIYMSDLDNNRIQEVPVASGTQWGQAMTANDMYTVAGSSTGTVGDSGNGGPAASALFDMAQSVSVDPAGDLYITDSGNNELREVISTTATTIAPAPGQISSLYPVPGSPNGTTTYGQGITVTQPGGAQVTFYTMQSGACTGPYEPDATSGAQYCVLPQDYGATLTESGGVYSFSPAPGLDTYTYSAATGQMTSDTDTAGDTLTIAYLVTPGIGSCPSGATSCDVITSASGRALTLALNSSGLISSVTDPMGRTWSYGYSTGDDLTSVTDPVGNKTTYTYGPGSGNTSPLLANDLLTITSPDAQPGYGGPDADPGADTTIAYSNAGQVTSQTDPMGWQTTLSYCVNAAAGDCLDSATGTGFVTVADPDGNNTVYDYQQGTVADQSAWTRTTSGLTLTSESDATPDTTAATASNLSGGKLLDTTTTDGDGNTTTVSYDADGKTTTNTAPDGVGSQTGTTTATYTSALQDTNCAGTDQASGTDTCNNGAAPPPPVAPGGIITPPASAPPLGVTYSLYDTDGNQLYTTTGVYSPTGTYEYSQTTYRLFKGNTITLNSTNISCTYTPLSASLPCAAINKLGVVTQLEYDSAGDLELSSTPDGNSGAELATTSYTYDADGEQLTEVAPDGNVSGGNAGNYTTTTVYNADGEETSVTRGGGTGYTDAPRTVSNGYDGDGNQVMETDARGYATTTTYNADDQAVLSTDPLGDASLTCYDGDGNAAQTVPAIGVAANGLTAASCPTSYPAGYSNRLATDATVDTFNALGQQTSETDPAPAGQSGYETTSYTYDADGNALTTTAPSPNGGSGTETVDTYNAAGELASESDGYGTTAESTVSYCYSPSGQQTSSVYADGNTAVTNVNGTITGLAACGTSYPWAVSATPQANYQTTYAYDSAGDEVSQTTPKTAVDTSGGTSMFTYDQAGNQLTSTDPAGVTTTTVYSPLGNPVSESFSGSAAHSVTWSYDANGQRTGMTDATGSSSYVYDPFGEVTSSANGAGQTTTYAYDADGDITGISYPLPSTATWATTDTVSYGYDITDGMTSVTDFNGNKIAITSDADGDPLTQTLGSSGDTITSTYDPAGDLATQNLANGSGTLQSFSYAFTPAGTITTETDVPSSLGSPSYTYDSLSRVLSRTPSGGSASDDSFDPSGNLTTLPTGATTNYDDAGELTSSTLAGTTTSYAYDADGRQLTGKQGTTTLTSATWNGASQLTSYTSPSGTMTATYDGSGLRATETGTTSQNFTWEAGNDQLLMDSTNAYIYGPGDVIAEQVNLATGTASYVLTDAIGSVRGIVSASGALVATTSYDAWGDAETTGGLTAYTPFGYAGGYTDPDGLIYLINRYFNPAEGQFISVDPDLSQTGEPYAYTGGDPLTQKDPDGLKYKTWNPTVSFSVTNNTTGWNISLCVVPNPIVSACVGNNLSVSNTGGHATFDVQWTSIKGEITLAQVSASYTTCQRVGIRGVLQCNEGLVQPVFTFGFWSQVTKVHHKSKLLWGHDDYLHGSEDFRGYHRGHTGIISLSSHDGAGPSGPAGSYFKFYLFAYDDYGGNGNVFYPVHGANAGKNLR
jgi:trimeric autotransporter adhesin